MLYLLRPALVLFVLFQFLIGFSQDSKEMWYKTKLEFFGASAGLINNKSHLETGHYTGHTEYITNYEMGLRCLFPISKHINIGLSVKLIGFEYLQYYTTEFSVAGYSNYPIGTTLKSKQTNSIYTPTIGASFHFKLFETKRFSGQIFIEPQIGSAIFNKIRSVEHKSTETGVSYPDYPKTEIVVLDPYYINDYRGLLFGSTSGLRANFKINPKIYLSAGFDFSYINTQISVLGSYGTRKNYKIAFNFPISFGYIF